MSSNLYDATNNTLQMISGVPKGRINAIEANEGDVFDPTRTSSNKYVAGDLVIYNNQLYKANQDHYGVWDATHFTATNLSDEITSINASLTHIGMIIHSTTLDTEAKVKAIYGSNTSWIQHSGYMLRGATSGVTANSATKTDGSDDAIVVSHSHRLRPVNEGKIISGHVQFGTTGNTYYCVNNTSQAAVDFGYTTPEGSSGTNANIPNYKSVYIWERIA